MGKTLVSLRTRKLRIPQTSNLKRDTITCCNSLFEDPQNSAKKMCPKSKKVSSPKLPESTVSIPLLRFFTISYLIFFERTPHQSTTKLEVPGTAFLTYEPTACSSRIQRTLPAQKGHSSVGNLPICKRGVSSSYPFQAFLSYPVDILGAQTREL